VGVSAEGLPIGVQLVDVRGDGAVLLGLAQLLEEQLRWAERRPAVSA
jgi:Asp-tRNA(Asn)/Glu-tRNA(Gln) amidotransferase A subunit family amidase